MLACLNSATAKVYVHDVCCVLHAAFHSRNYLPMGGTAETCGMNFYFIFKIISVHMCLCVCTHMCICVCVCGHVQVSIGRSEDNLWCWSLPSTSYETGVFVGFPLWHTAQVSWL